MTAGGYRTSALEASSDFQLSAARYVVEDMGEGIAGATECTSDIDLSAPTCTTSGGGARNYRITVLARTDNGAEVVLQSAYQVP